MIQSMTGYASNIFNFQHITVNITVKTVNSRFFDFHSCISDDIPVTEYEIRQLFEKKIQRGKINLKLNTELAENYYQELKIDNNILAQYMKLSAQICERYPAIQPFNMIDIFNAPGIIIKNSLDQNQLKTLINNQLELLIDELLNNQTAEGKNMYVILNTKLDNMNQIIMNIRHRIPSIIDSYKNKIINRFKEFLIDVSTSEQRLAQEFAIFCQKIDIDEELSRLESHIQQFKATINSHGLNGKKLDFISQEMLREANTLGSKSISTITTNATIELKILIEQIKEQIQNIK